MEEDERGQPEELPTPEPTEVEQHLFEIEKYVLASSGLTAAGRVWLAEYIYETRYWFGKCGIRTLNDLERLLSEKSFFGFLSNQREGDLRTLTIEYFKRNPFAPPRDFYEWIGRLAVSGQAQFEDIVRDVMRLRAGGVLDG